MFIFIISLTLYKLYKTSHMHNTMWISHRNIVILCLIYVIVIFLFSDNFVPNIIYFPIYKKTFMSCKWRNNDKVYEIFMPKIYCWKSWCCVFQFHLFCHHFSFFPLRSVLIFVLSWININEHEWHCWNSARTLFQHEDYSNCTYSGKSVIELAMSIFCIQN